MSSGALHPERQASPSYGDVGNGGDSDDDGAGDGARWRSQSPGPAGARPLTAPRQGAPRAVLMGGIRGVAFSPNASLVLAPPRGAPVAVAAAAAGDAAGEAALGPGATPAARRGSGASDARIAGMATAILAAVSDAMEEGEGEGGSASPPLRWRMPRLGDGSPPRDRRSPAPPAALSPTVTGVDAAAASAAPRSPGEYSMKWTTLDGESALLPARPLAAAGGEPGAFPGGGARRAGAPGGASSTGGSSRSLVVAGGAGAAPRRGPAPRGSSGGGGGGGPAAAFLVCGAPVALALQASPCEPGQPRRRHRRAGGCRGGAGALPSGGGGSS